MSDNEKTPQTAETQADSASSAANTDAIDKESMIDPSAADPTPVDAVDNKEDGVYEALRSVVDPEIGMNIIELGLVRQVDIQEDSSHITMIMTTPFCPYAPQLLEQTRRTAQDYLGTPTTIEMGMEMWDPSMMEDGAASDWGLF